MPVIDLHCDTIAKLAEMNHGEGLDKNSLNIDIAKLGRGGSLVQFFSLFVDSQETNSPLISAQNLLQRFQQEMLINKSAISLAKNIADIQENQAANKISAVITLEGGEVLAGDMANLRWFYEQGVRLITLTWNYPNELGYPNLDYTHQNKGLTDFGKECVTAMRDLGIIVDVSHLSDQGFYDVADLVKGPFVASHSNSRTITNHARNLTDAMIRVLAEHGGAVGINFYSEFLDGSEFSKIQSIVEHIEHIYQVGGIEVVALGTDFDGIDSRLEIADFGQLDLLWDNLRQAGFTTGQIDKITHENAWRIMRDCWQS